MVKYADNSNKSDTAVNQDDDADSARENQSVRAECDSNLESDGADEDFCVDGSRP
jgi:hypothetical protein